MATIIQNNDGSLSFKYEVSYECGEEYSFTIYARDFRDAERRLEAIINTASLVGQVVDGAPGLERLDHNLIIKAQIDKVCRMALDGESHKEYLIDALKTIQGIAATLADDLERVEYILDRFMQFKTNEGQLAMGREALDIIRRLRGTPQCL